MSRDRALASALIIACLGGTIAENLHGAGLGPVFGAISIGATAYLLLTWRGAS